MGEDLCNGCDSLVALRKALCAYGNEARKTQAEEDRQTRQAKRDAEIAEKLKAVDNSHAINVKLIDDVNTALQEASRQREEALRLGEETAHHRMEYTTNLVLRDTPVQEIKRVCTMSQLFQFLLT